MKRIALALLLTIAASPAGAEKLVSTVSNPNVQITSSFDGATLSLFGNVESGIPGVAAQGPFNVIITITGPLQDRVTRVKSNVFGIWTNTDEVAFKRFPSFYAVLSSGKVKDIADPELVSAEAIAPFDQALIAAPDDGGAKGQLFGYQLVRLMTEQGHVVVDEDGVRFLSTTAYMAQVTLPSDVPNGNFLTHTIVLDASHHQVADNTQGFIVRKSGFENFVFIASRQQPLLYGIVCVALALGTGWLAGVAFKR